MASSVAYTVRGSTAPSLCVILAAMSASLLLGIADLKAQQFTVTRGVNRPGSDYVRLPATTVQNCQDRCAQDGKCRTFVFAAPPDSRAGCYLKEVIPTEVRDACCTTGVRSTSGPALAPPAAPRPVSAGESACFSLETGINRPGNDYSRTPAVSVDQCQQLCAKDASCQTFVYAAPPDPRAGCYLKRERPGPVKDACCTTGLRVACGASTPAPAAPVSPAARKSLTGPWIHSADPASTIAPSIVLMHEGDRVKAVQFWKSRDRWMTLACEGNLAGDELRLQCNYAPGGNPFGFANLVQTLKLAPSGDALDGVLQASGQTQETHWRRAP